MRWSLALTLGTLVVGAAPASADPIIFTDRAAFEAAVGHQTTLYGFDTPTPCEIVPQTGSCDATFDDFKIMWDLPEIPPDFIVQQHVLVGGGATHLLRVVLNEPVSAIGFDVTATDGNAFLVGYSGGVIPLRSTVGFFGIIDTTDLIATLELAPWTAEFTYGAYTIDNLTISTPEPAILGLLSVAALAAKLRQRYQRRRGCQRPNTSRLP